LYGQLNNVYIKTKLSNQMMCLFVDFLEHHKLKKQIHIGHAEAQAILTIGLNFKLIILQSLKICILINL